MKLSKAINLRRQKFNQLIGLYSILVIWSPHTPVRTVSCFRKCNYSGLLERELVTCCHLSSEVDHIAQTDRQTYSQRLLECVEKFNGGGREDHILVPFNPLFQVSCHYIVMILISVKIVTNFFLETNPWWNLGSLNKYGRLNLNLWLMFVLSTKF